MTQRVQEANNNEASSLRCKSSEIEGLFSPKSATWRARDAFVKKTLNWLSVILIIDLISFSFILPLQPSMLDYYSKDGKDGLYTALSDAVDTTLRWSGAPLGGRWNAVLFGGAVSSLFSLLQFLTSPLIGALSDVYGRTVVLLLSTMGVAVSYALWCQARLFSMFVLSRFIGGMFKGNVTLSAAIATDVTDEKQRGRAMMRIGIAFSIAFLIGPSIGAGFSSFARDQSGFFMWPAIFALALSVIDIVLIMATLPETLPLHKRARSLIDNLRDALHLIDPLSLFRFSAARNLTTTEKKTLQRIGVVYFLYLFLFSGLESSLVFLVHDRFQYTSVQQGKMFLVIGVLMAVFQGGYVRRLKENQERKVVLMGIAVLIPSFVLMAFASNQIVLYLSLILYCFASATVVTCLTTMTSLISRSGQTGRVLGILRALGSLARALGPFAACAIYWSYGSSVCYLIGACSFVLPLWLAIGIKTSVQ